VSNRRQFITLLGGAAAWPLAARAQPAERMRRIGVLTSLAASDPEARLRISAFKQELARVGWIEEKNVRIDVRWPGDDPRELRFYADELLTLKPDVILAGNQSALQPLRKETRIPIVFAQVNAPVETGIVTSLAKPGGNITGFINFEHTVAGKWPETLKEAAPRIKRMLVLLDLQVQGSSQLVQSIESASSSLALELTSVPIRDPAEIDPTFSAFAREANGGVIIMPGPVGARHRERFVAALAAHRLPAIYPYRYWIESGGLMSYGVDTIDPWRRAANYVDRILRGEKPADLPVQAPTKFELVINLKTAKALGLDMPPTLLARADEVIE
jgi:putative tryptophan/tyrosine transport system substrate-binding protein